MYKQLTDKELLNILCSASGCRAVYVTEKLIIQTANSAMLAFWGKDSSVIGKNLLDIYNEFSGSYLESESHRLFLEEVWETGKDYTFKKIKKTLQVNGSPKDHYFDVSYETFINAEGLVYAIMHTALDVTGFDLLDSNIQDIPELQELNYTSLSATEAVEYKNRKGVADIESDYENFLEPTPLIEQLTGENSKLKAVNWRLIEENKNVYKRKEHLRMLMKDLDISESKFKSMVDQAPIAIAVLTGRKFIVTSANRLILQMWGKSDKIINMQLEQAVPELDGQVFIPLLNEVFASGIPYLGYEILAKINLGSEIRDHFLNVIFEPIKNSEGITISIMVVFADVTSHVLSKKELQKDQDFLRFSIMAADIGTWSVDLNSGESNIALKNKKLFGFSEEDEVSHELLRQQITPEFRAKVEAELNKVTVEGGICDITYSAVGFHDQKLRWIRTVAGVVNDKDGIASYISGISIETTQQKHDELRKSQFISIVSHELKTPLTTIKGYIQLAIQKANVVDDQFISKILNKADSSVGKMTSIINSFLNLSQLEIGKIGLVNQTFVLEELIREVSDEANIFGKEKRVKFSHESLTHINADRNKIEQVITNLISNADKYSPAGSHILIECSSDTEMVTIKVKDNGRGINPEDHQKIFEKYFRVENNENEIISGFGIGLYLCKEIIDRHNGSLWVESEPNEGSVFIFNLPLN